MMDKNIYFLIGFVLAFAVFFTEVNSLVKFTNFECETLDKTFCEVDRCILKSANRTYKYLSARIKLLKIPLTNLKVNFALYQRLNGYKPFLYNVTVDGCQFLKNTNSNPVASYFFQFLKNVSNMNHTCPFNHDLVVDKLTAEQVNHQVTKVLPFPKGTYMIQTHWMAYGMTRAITKFYLSLT